MKFFVMKQFCEKKFVMTFFCDEKKICDEKCFVRNFFCDDKNCDEEKKFMNFFYDISELVCTRKRARTGLSRYETRIGANIGATPINQGFQVFKVVPPGQNLCKQVHQVLVFTEIPKLLWKITIHCALS